MININGMFIDGRFFRKKRLFLLEIELMPWIAN